MFNSKEISAVLGGQTNDVKEFEITEISVDSRTVNHPEATLFFALTGANHDGHDYVEDLYRRGVCNFVVSRPREEIAPLVKANVFVVPDVLEALQRFAKWHRDRMSSEVIGITGSNGKTIVKEWLYQMLADDTEVYRSPRSYNSQVGVPLSLLGIKPETRVSIIEAGISKPGEMERLENIIHPEIGIFTHLGDAHGENFTSLDQKLREKAILFRDSFFVIGRESEEMNTLLSTLNPGAEPMLWGESPVAQVRIVSQSIKAGRRNVRLRYENLNFTIHIPFIDVASFENVMHAVCILLLKRKSPEEISARVARLQPIAMRMEIKEGINRCILINDYYNSDAASFHLALRVLAMQEAGREKVVILSDFVDTGNDDRLLYREVARQLQEADVSLLIGVGEKITRYQSVFMLPRCRFYLDTESFVQQENRNEFEDQVILIKGARRFHFEDVSALLQKQSHSTLLEVDLDAMVSNLNYFRGLVPRRTKIAVMVKAFSYGSGAGEIASLLQYQGVDYLMVAFADEGVELRRAGIKVNIAVMNPEPEAFDLMIEHRLEPEIYSFELLEGFEQALVRHGKERYPVHLKLNTGMNRSGLDEDEIPRLLQFFLGYRRMRLRSMFSHLAGSDESKLDDFTRSQVSNFVRMTDQLQAHFNYSIMRHILNSAGIERFPRYAFDMVRLGIGLHGISATGARLHPVSTFRTYIASIRRVPARQTVGYGRKGVLRRETRIAVIPVGYADGLNRHLSCGVGQVMINGQRCPIVGNICMDACMVDITDVDASVGDSVEIFGKHIPVSEVAKKLDTIPYEVLTSVSQRVKRVYYKEES